MKMCHIATVATSIYRTRTKTLQVYSLEPTNTTSYNTNVYVRNSSLSNVQTLKVLFW